MRIRLTVVSAVLISLTLIPVPVDLAAAPGAPELDCLIEPYVVVNLSTPVSGLVETVAERGTLVEKGQVVATLESSLETTAVAIARFRAEAEAAIKTNQARVEFSTRQLARNKELFDKGTVTSNELDEVATQKLLADLGLLEAQENQRLARLDLQRATAVLALRTVRSPITGVVMARFLAPGELAGDTPLLRLAQLDPLRVEVFAPVALIGQIRVGLRGQVIPEAPVGGVHAARVTVVDRVVDAASGTFGVRLELPNPGNRLPAGLKCRVRFLR